MALPCARARWTWVAAWFSVLGLLLLPTSVPALDAATDTGSPALRMVRDDEYRARLTDIDQKLRFKHDHEETVRLLFQKGELASLLSQFATALDAYDKIAGMCSSASDPDALLARMYQAEVYGIQGKLQQAAGTYQQVVRNADADTPQHRMYRQTARDRIAAIATLTRYVQEGARTSDRARRTALTFATSELYEQIKAFDAAVREFKRFIEQDPSDERAPEAQYRIGEIHARRGAFREASQAYERVVRDYPASRFDTFALFQLGRLYMAQHDASLALEMFDRLLEERPVQFKLGEAYYLRAVCLERLGRLDEAIGAYRFFIDRVLEHGLPIKMSDLGRTEKDTASLRSALEAKIRSLLQQHPARLLSRARTDLEEGRAQEAWLGLQQLASQYSDTPEALQGAELLPTADARREAEWQLRVAEESPSVPTRARAVFNAATVYEQRLRDYDQALPLFRQVVEMDAQSGAWRRRALLRVGTIYGFELHDQKKGLDAFEQLVRQAPASGEAASACLLMGDILLQRNLDEAIQAWRRVLTMAEQTADPPGVYVDSPADEAAFRIARALYDRGRYRDAVEALRDYVRTRSQSPRIAAAWLFMSRIYERMGDRRNAADAMREAVRLTSENPALVHRVLGDLPPDQGPEEVLSWMQRRLDSLVRPVARRRSP